jgi:hypothetical protein
MCISDRYVSQATVATAGRSYIAASSFQGLERAMIFASTVAERAILSVDHFLNQAMTYAWMTTLEHRGGYERPLLSGWRQQPAAEDEYGGGDICSPEVGDQTDDDQPLD